MRYIIVRKSVFLLLCICGAAFLANYGLHITICKSIIKYDSKGTVQWKKQYQDFNNGSKNKISSIIETSDGDYVVGGYFVGVINLENGNILQSDSSKAEQGFLIKFKL